jgi:predicted aspartyl protease
LKGQQSNAGYCERFTRPRQCDNAFTGSRRLSLEFQIDTAFQGSLAIPADAVALLGLPFVAEIQTLPANGIPFRANAHQAVIEWDEPILNVSALAIGIRPLIGSALLDRHDLYIRYAEGAEALIDLMPENESF